MSNPPAPPLEIRLFGPFEARVNGAPLPRLRSRKTRWLLGLLAMRAGRETERLWLAFHLWPDSPEPAAMASLRSSLKDLRQALGPAQERLWAPAPHTLSLEVDAAHVDLLAFDAAMARGEPDSPTRYAALEEALALYRGPLLEGCAEPWAFEARREREEAYLSACESLAARAMAGGEWAAAERHLRRIVANDPLREGAQRALMEVLAAAGSYAAALLVYRELRLRLHGELNAEPDTRTHALFQRLQAESRRRAHGTTVEGRVPDDLGLRSPTTDCRPPTDSALTRSQEPGARSVRPSEAGCPARKIALLYKRGAQPDEALRELLERRLSERGHDVFVDRHLTVGLEWAREIEARMRSADAVVPILSPASVHSEMLACELQIAAEAAARSGRPRILPVRVAAPGPFPDPIAALLSPIQHAFWDGPADDERLVAELLRALESGPATGDQRPATNHQGTMVLHSWAVPHSGTAAPDPLEPVGGAVPLDSAFYVARPVDALLARAIARRDSIVLIKGARQMGKTSLLARGLHQARSAGARIVRTDFQTLNALQLESLDTLFLQLADSIADQLDLDAGPEEIWGPHRGPSENFKRYWHRVVLRAVEVPIVWGLDEIDRLFAVPFAGEVFGLFRSWHNDRALDPGGPWRRLTLALAYATEASLFITDIHQSPFNVGTRLTLEDFTLEQIADLNDRYGSPLRDEPEIARFAQLVGGQPYLVRRGLHEMVLRGVELDTLAAQADRDEGIYGDHLRRMLVLLAQDAELCEALREVLRGKPCPTLQGFYRLRSAGVIAGGSAEDARPRCQLYAAYLAQHLL